MMLDAEEVFHSLDEAGITYGVLRSIDQLALKKFIYKNDVDIIVPHDNIDNLRKVLKILGFRAKSDSLFAYEYLYNAKPHIHFYHPNLKLHLDVCKVLMVRSPDSGQFVSLDNEFQDFAISTIKKTEDYWRYQVSDETMLIYLISHCIYDKRVFKKEYQSIICENRSCFEKRQFLYFLDKIFFENSEFILKNLKEENFGFISELYNF